MTQRSEPAAAATIPTRLSHCAVCGAPGGRSVWSVDKAPLHPLRPAGAADEDRGFGQLAIVECETCGHLFNAAFDVQALDDLYAAFVLTNVPVSASMIEAVESTAAVILGRARPRPSVLEVGGGGGALSLALAAHGAEVCLVEPSRAVSADRFARTGVTFHHGMFPTPWLGARRFDVVVCRQVIEHVPEPEPFLTALRASMTDDGVAYVELPSAEYIRRNNSVVDFHYPHVHYYRRPEIEVLFARAGFAPADVIEVKSGHDIAFVLRATRPTAMRAPSPDLTDITPGLASRRMHGGRRLAALGGPLALYGANAYAQALLGLYPDSANVTAMFDDTPAYAGRCAYGPSLDLPIAPPTAERLRQVVAVVITAYLHDRDINRKVRGLGFRGPVYSVRTDPMAGTDDQPPSLFAL
jgi:SAM-dependent methyltransferase